MFLKCSLERIISFLNNGIRMFPQGADFEVSQSKFTPVSLFILGPWTSPCACHSLGSPICDTEPMTPRLQSPETALPAAARAFPLCSVEADPYAKFSPISPKTAVPQKDARRQKRRGSFLSLKSECRSPEALDAAP